MARYYVEPQNDKIVRTDLYLVRLEKADGEVTVAVSSFHDTNVTVACAVYDADGKQIGIEMVEGGFNGYVDASGNQI